MPNLLEQLKQQDVPAPPSRLRQEVRERMNVSLLVLALADLVLRGLPFVAVHLAQALGGLLLLTFTGSFEARQRPDARDEYK